jgi:hypothetical protein
MTQEVSIQKLLRADRLFHSFFDGGRNTVFAQKIAPRLQFLGTSEELERKLEWYTNALATCRDTKDTLELQRNCSALKAQLQRATVHRCDYTETERAQVKPSVGDAFEYLDKKEVGWLRVAIREVWRDDLEFAFGLFRRLTKHLKLSDKEVESWWTAPGTSELLKLKKADVLQKCKKLMFQQQSRKEGTEMDKLKSVLASKFQVILQDLQDSRHLRLDLRETDQTVLVLHYADKLQLKQHVKSTVENSFLQWSCKEEHYPNCVFWTLSQCDMLPVLKMNGLLPKTNEPNHIWVVWLETPLDSRNQLKPSWFSFATWYPLPYA